MFIREPRRGLRLDWDGRKYNLVFGPTTGDLYEQLNQKVALLVWSGIYTKDEIEHYMRMPKDTWPMYMSRLRDVYEWYHEEFKRVYRHDYTKWLRRLALRIFDWLHKDTGKCWLFQVHTKPPPFWER